MLTGKTILRHKETKHIYFTEDMFNFTDLTTGRTGTKDNEQAKATLIIPLTINDMYQNNPIILELITKLKLAVE